MRFSIIIPVYNVEQYIQKCMESVLAQTFKDYEVIVVDDETPDRSIEVIQPYVQAHPDTVRIIHQKNRGLGGARNTGAAAAKGDYLVFLDSDDYIREDMLQILDEKLEKSQCEILIFNFAEVNEQGEIITKRNLCGLEEGIYEPLRDVQLFTISPEAWNKVYLRRFYEESGIIFPEKTLYEDTITWVLLGKAKKVQLCADHLYYYVHRNGSIMHRGVSEKMLDIIKMVEFVRTTTTQDGIYDQIREPLEMSLLRSLLAIFSRINEIDCSSALQGNISQYICEHFTQYDQNPYIDNSVKEMIALICQKKYKAYHSMAKVRRMKDRLLRIPFVSKLNALRRK